MEKNYSDQPRHLHSIFTRPPAFDTIFREFSPASLIRMGRTCRVARDAVSSFYSRAFNINRHLSRFFTDPLAFRSLQARTGTLISGSNALQFLDRTFYPDSDLDVYVHPGPYALEMGHWLQSDGYTFVPNSIQSAHFDEAHWSRFHLHDLEGSFTEVDVFHAQHYRIRGVSAVFTFEKQTGSHSNKALKVQIMVGKHTPLQAILGFHSSCVMNIIAFDAAYSFYPAATFEERRSLAMADLTEKDAAALGKYALRGWSIVSNIWPHEEKTTKLSFHLRAVRQVCDKHSWIVPLSMTGVEPRPRLSPLSEEFDWDPVVNNSWRLVQSESSDIDCIVPLFEVAHTSIFRYRYLIADKTCLTKLVDFFNDQGRIEHLKASTLSQEDKEKSWTWWDASLPGFHEAYTEKPDGKTMDESGLRSDRSVIRVHVEVDS